MITRKKGMWKSASPLSKVYAVILLIIALFTLSGILTGKLQKWIVEPVTEPMILQRHDDSIRGAQVLDDLYDSLYDHRTDLDFLYKKSKVEKPLFRN